MAKKLSLLMASLAIVACIAPAIADASKLTEPVGTLVSIGQLLEATSNNSIMETSLGKLSCEQVTNTAEVTVNNGSTFKAIGKGVNTASTCFVGGTKAITVTDVTISEIHSATAGTGTISLTFEADLPGGITVCHFASPNLPFTYTSGTDSIKFTKADLKATPAACEPGTVSGDFTLETDGTNTAVILD